MRTAFKEWAVICRALSTGRQTIILRKGGIAEPRGKFEPAMDEFLLLPTYVHESREQIAPEARNLFDEVIRERPPAGRVRIELLARVQLKKLVRDWAIIQALASEHVWSGDVVAERFHRWRDGVDVLCARIYRLPGVVELDMREEYGGCKSWATLVEDLSIDGATPVLADDEFQRRLQSIRMIFEA